MHVDLRLAATQPVIRTELFVRRLLMGLLACAALLFLCSPETSSARALAESDKQRAILDLENRWLQSEDNAGALQSILADDFIHVLPSGFVTKADQLKYVRTHPLTQHQTRKHFENLRVRIFDRTAIVNGIVVATGPDRQARKTIFTDVFAYRDGRWQAVNAQESPLGGPGR